MIAAIHACASSTLTICNAHIACPSKPAPPASCPCPLPAPSALCPSLELDERGAQPSAGAVITPHAVARFCGFFFGRPPTLITCARPPTSPSATYTTLSSLISSRSSSRSSGPGPLKRCRNDRAGSGFAALFQGDVNTGALAAEGEGEGSTQVSTRYLLFHCLESANTNSEDAG